MYRFSVLLFLVLLLSFSCSRKKIQSSDEQSDYRFMALPDSVLPREETYESDLKEKAEPYSYKSLNAQFMGNVSFRKTGEGEDIFINFRSSGAAGKIRMLPGLIVRSESLETYQQPDHLSFYDAKFPFNANLRYEVEIYNGMFLQRSFIELEIEINQPGSWRVNIYH